MTPNEKKTSKATQQVCVEIQKDMGWLKSLLNNTPLLKWVKKFSADHLLEDNQMAKKYAVSVNDDSISIADTTLTKLLVTNSRYAGKQYVKYSMSQLAEVINLLGSEGELIIGAENNKEMFIQIKDTTIVVCPLGKDDAEEQED